MAALADVVGDVSGLVLQGASFIKYRKAVRGDRTASCCRSILERVDVLEDVFAAGTVAIAAVAAFGLGQHSPQSNFRHHGIFGVSNLAPAFQEFVSKLQNPLSQRKAGLWGGLYARKNVHFYFLLH